MDLKKLEKSPSRRILTMKQPLSGCKCDLHLNPVLPQVTTQSSVSYRCQNMNIEGERTNPPPKTSAGMILKVVMIISCTGGFLFQVDLVSEVYFQHQTDTWIRMAASKVISVPAVSACFKILDLIDNDYVKNALGIDLETRQDHGFDSQYYYGTLSRLKISDLFAATLEPQSVLELDSSCLLRFPPKSFGASLDAKECYHEIYIKKYIQRDFVCYELTPHFQSELHVEDYSLKDWSINMIYKIRFKNESFEDTHSFIVLIHTPETTKFYDSL